MLGQVVRDYLQRFSNVMTESVYASKGLEDYSRMKRYCDYLDYDRTTLFREKGKAEAGLRNIGNTCYLNVILQLLFHVNYLREKIFNADLKSELIQLVKSLFAEMAIGRLTFADPSDLFEHLRASSPETFVAGVQNDFHEIMTVLIDRLSESYKEAAPEEARFIRKLLFGRMVTRIDFAEGRTTKAAPFNIINLDVAEGSFDKAFDHWRYYKIEGYETPKGTKVTASAENVFLQTPAMMAFFINRVSYRGNKLQKDTRAFQFEPSILIQKTQQSERTRPAKQRSAETEKEYLDEKAALNEWLIRVDAQRSHLVETLKYLRAKEAPLLSAPQVSLSLNGQVDNQLGEAARTNAVAYLEKELEVMELKVEEVRREVAGIEERLRRLEEEGNYETYLLWAVMIHQGPSAVSGHYKVCISINEKWYEYNDRTVSLLPPGQMEQYKQKGEICCLFYRRPTLLCDSQRIPIPLALKNAVSQQERETRREIDKARLLQALYQETESANILLQHQIHYGSRQPFQFFFRPVHYALAQQLPLQTCRGIMVMEAITSQGWRNAFASRLVSEESTDISFPRIGFGVPQEYFAAADTLKAFLAKQAFLLQVPTAYEELAGRRLKISKKAVKQRYLQMMQIIVLKGLYYLRMLPENGLIDAAGTFKLSTSIDKILEGMDHASEFVLVAIAIKSSIGGKVGELRKERSMLKTITIENFGDYFSENFRFWIRQREILAKLDESNFVKDAPPLPIKE